MNKKNLSLFIKKILIFLIPFLIIIAGYLISDPFKVTRIYKEYKNNPVLLNQGYICWQSYLNHKDNLKYDSYILGNSCTVAFPTNIWKPYIKDAVPIRLFGDGESLYAIYKKVKRLDQSGVPIKNVLLLLDNSTLKNVDPNNSHTRILHPDISPIGVFEFQKEFIIAFFNLKFLLPYADYCLFHTYRKYMKGILTNKDLYRNQITNDFRNPREDEIEIKKEQYWLDHKKEFPKRDRVIAPYSQSIFNKQKNILTEISEIFKKNQTNYHIVINPEWSQKELNNKDLSELKKIFELNRIHNFSGKNIYTENQKNFYEMGHYRPLLGKIILQRIYKQ